jgi:tripartite-type tricarboxylate transporter receptor subunit TctC
MPVQHILRALACIALCAVPVGPAAAADTFPGRAVKIIVPYPPSGTSDFLARLIAPKLGESWGVPVIVDNRPGASGNIGMDVVAKSPADGLTLAMTNSAVAINVAMFPKLSFDVAQDFEPLGLIGSTPMVMSVNPNVPAKTLAELTDYAKRNPGKLTFGSCGWGTPQHLAIELYRSMVGVNMLHVPYKGCAPAVTDAIGGQVQVLATTASQGAAQINAGTLRGLAVTSSRRSASLPDIPTFQEAGLSGYRLDIWFGLMAPAKTPDAILTRIYQSVREIVQSSDVVERMRASGVEELVTTRQEHAAVLKEDLAKYSRLFSELKLTPPSE